MAAIAAGQGTSYGDGIAPGARIVNVKVGASNGAVDVSQVIAAIDWVVEHRHQDGMNIRVLNLSYGTDSRAHHGTDPLSYAVENAWNHGIAVVVSAGNETRNVVGLANPASNPFVIAVGGAGKSVIHDSGWKAADWTTRGNANRHPDIVAPGECLLSAGLPGSALYETSPSSAQHFAGAETYLRGSGTSQAAAVVSGSVAVLLEQRPWLTPDQIKTLITDNGRQLHTDLHRNNKLRKAQTPQIAGSGLLDLAAILDSADPAAATQHFTPARGTGSLHLARGTQIVGDVGDQLIGEQTAFGSLWDPATGSDGIWSGATWSSGTWSGGTWSGGTWSGATWSGATWSGGTWSGATWSGATWSGATWSGATWSSVATS